MTVALAGVAVTGFSAAGAAALAAAGVAGDAVGAEEDSEEAPATGEAVDETRPRVRMAPEGLGASAGAPAALRMGLEGLSPG